MTPKSGRSAIEPSPGLLPLPSGRSGLPREAIERDQRRRIIAGAARALAEYGYAEMTVAQIIAFAHVSKATFYKNFKNRQDCVAVRPRRDLRALHGPPR